MRSAITKDTRTFFKVGFVFMAGFWCLYPNYPHLNLKRVIIKIFEVDNRFRYKYRTSTRLMSNAAQYLNVDRVLHFFIGEKSPHLNTRIYDQKEISSRTANNFWSQLLAVYETILLKMNIKFCRKNFIIFKTCSTVYLKISKIVLIHKLYSA